MPPTKAQCLWHYALAKKNLFFTFKISKMTKIAPNFLKFGMSGPFQVI